MNTMRPSFIGEALANMLVALLTALVVDYLVSPSWFLPLAIAAGWLCAVAIAALCCRLILLRLVGSINIVMSAMMTAVIVGIAIAITSNLTQLALLDHLLIAAIIALLDSIAFQVSGQEPIAQRSARDSAAS
jgi:hypothetical protein